MTHFLRCGDVQAMTGLSRSTIFRLEKAKKFPPRVRLTENSVAWRADEVREWCESRPLASTAPMIPNSRKTTAEVAA